jgi:hypothetical protein
MRAALERLRAEVRSDRAAIGRWLDELAGLELAAGASPATLAQAAWALHHAYSGVEAILERTTRTIEGGLPEGPDSHRALLDAAALDIEDIRPPLISRATLAGLHELRGFRHFVRHAYAVDLDPERLSDLRRRAVELRPGLETDLDRLEAWLTEIARSSDA